MRKVIIAALLSSGLSGASYAAVNLTAQAQMDYMVTVSSNHLQNSYNNFYLNWASFGLYGDITRTIKANLLFDLSANTPTPADHIYVWYAYLAWTLMPGSVLTVGLQDSLFGFMVPSNSFGRNIDYGLTWSQNFADVFGYSIQLVKGELSVLQNWFDAYTVYDGAVITTTSRMIPAAQALLSLTPFRGFTVGGAGRFSTYSYNYFLGSVTNVVFEIGAEGYIAINSEFVPGLTFSMDYVRLMNLIQCTNSTTNADSFYFAADMNYKAGWFTPGFRYWIRDSNLAAISTNDINQFIAVYAKIDLSGDGMASITPYFEYRLTENGSNRPENVAMGRVRFDIQFDLPVVKDPEPVN